MGVDRKATKKTRERYQRLAPVYDTIEVLAEAQYAQWRQQLWSLVEGPKVLEVGVGTGKNMPYYPDDLEVTAIDLTPGMVERARRRAEELDLDVTIKQDDTQELDFPNAMFDTVVSTFVFCSVPDPLLGLDELARVTKPSGRLVMLEHVRSPNPLLGAAMELANPVVVRLVGANINRQTVQNVDRSPWNIERVENQGLGGIFKLIVARKAIDTVR